MGRVGQSGPKIADHHSATTEHSELLQAYYMSRFLTWLHLAQSINAARTNIGCHDSVAAHPRFSHHTSANPHRSAQPFNWAQPLFQCQTISSPNNNNQSRLQKDPNSWSPAEASCSIEKLLRSDTINQFQSQIGRAAPLTDSISSPMLNGFGPNVSPQTIASSSTWKTPHHTGWPHHTEDNRPIRAVQPRYQHNPYPQMLLRTHKPAPPAESPSSGVQPTPTTAESTTSSYLLRLFATIDATTRPTDSLTTLPTVQTRRFHGVNVPTKYNRNTTVGHQRHGNSKGSE